MVIDDSPDVFYEKFWAFLGVDIPVAYIEPWDFINILDMIDIKFLNILEQYPEDEWDRVAVIEYEKKIINNTLKLIPKRIYLVTELWDDVRAKVYNKMCRARGGFTLNALTEQRTKTKVEEVTSMEKSKSASKNQQREKEKWSMI